MKTVDGRVVFTVKIVPSSSKTIVAGLLGEMIRIKVSAAPERGKANECLVKYLVRILGVRKKAVSILSGKTSVVKQIAVLGVSKQDVSARLAEVGGFTIC